jgi:protein gp37
MIDMRRDLQFIIITKRIDRFLVSLPDNWGDGNDHVSIGCTCENQDRADYRLPIFLNMPIKHKFIVCEPLIENIDLSPYLCREIEKVIVGGESGNEARVCDFDWVLSIRDNFAMSNVPFSFKQTGAVFRKNGKTYRVPRIRQFEQAKRSAIDIF